MKSPTYKAAPAFLVALAMIAFVLNWVWEMVQMPAYDGMPGPSEEGTAGLCTAATGGDVGITLAVYLIIA